jgi:hypothetical protein
MPVRLLIMLLTCPVALSAMDIEAVRFARRALLDAEARKHLQCGVGEVEHLSACHFAKGDFDGDGKADEAALTRRDKKAVLALFAAGREQASPTGIMLLSNEPDSSAAVQKMPGRDCLSVSIVARHEDTETTCCRLFRWDGKSWVQALEFNSSVTRTEARGRFRRETRTGIEVCDAKAELVMTSRDVLDGKELAGSATRTTVMLELTTEGAYCKGASAGEDTPIPTRVQLARTLEREGLDALALEQAEAALAKAERDKLAENDARLLDARALRQRLKTRVEAARAVASR